MSHSHPFTTVKSPSEVCNYLRDLMPANQFEAQGAWGRFSLNYVWAIASYFAAHPAAGLACTVANVAATILQRDQARVLALLGSFEESAKLAQPMISAWELGAKTQVMGVVSSLQINLKYLNVEEAAVKVASFLLPRQPLPERFQPAV